MIVSLHGIDSAGKMTQAAALVTLLKASPLAIAQFDFPHYDSTTGEVIKRVIKGETIVAGWPEVVRAANASEDGGDVNDLKQAWSADKSIIIQSLMTANRYEVLGLLQAHAGTTTSVLVLDRYDICGEVYSEADGVDPLWTASINSGLPPADLAVLLDIPVEESFRRRPERRDYYESNKEKLKAVRAGYLKRFSSRQEQSTVYGPQYLIVDGTREPWEITNTIRLAVFGVLALKQGMGGVR